MPLSIENLHIQTTRACNANCLHCICGPAEDEFIHPEYIETLLSQVEFINTLVVIGGEPSLAPLPMSFISFALKQFKIPVHKIVIVSNGLNVKPDVVWSFKNLLSNAMHESYVELSNDEYHPEIIESNYDTLSKHMNCVWQWDKSDPEDYSQFKVYYENETILEKIPHAIPQPKERVWKYGENIIGDILFLNVFGRIGTGVRSYRSQDREYVCSVDELSDLADGELLNVEH